MLRLNYFRHFIRLEAASGLLLGVATVIALLLANSCLQSYYQSLLHTEFYLGPVVWSWHFSCTHAVNDGLMTAFFLLVSLEIKRELMEGQLNSRAKALLPVVAALGGVVVPALFYFACTRYCQHYWSGWAIPTATDIAFALGVLSLLGSHISSALKVFLTALAIIDDLVAIAIIALYYTQDINSFFLVLAGGNLLVLALLNYFAVNRCWPYMGIGLLLWFCILQSGLHATLAGVLLGFAIPLRTKPPLLHKVERQLHPWIAYVLMPLFALVNAGLDFAEIHRVHLCHPLFWGIFLGLFAGKQLGIFTASWLAIKSGITKLPTTMSWRQLYGVAVVCGVGFTMSLFIGTLAFSDNQARTLVRLGVLTASLLSSSLGYFLLAGSAKKQRISR